MNETDMNANELTKSELNDLYCSQRMSLWDICKHKDVPYGSLSRRMDSLGIKKRDRWDASREKIMRQLPEGCNLNNPNFGYILGVRYGDGWIGGDRTLCLKVNDKEFIERFKGASRKIGLFPTKTREVIKNGRNMQYYSSVCSVVLAEFIHSIKIEKLYKMSIEAKKGFIIGFFDSEGCVTTTGKQKVVKFTNYSKRVLIFIQDTLKEFGIKTSLFHNRTRTIIDPITKRTYTPKQKYVYNLAICRYGHILEFSNLLNDLGGVLSRKQKIIDKLNTKYILNWANAIQTKEIMEASANRY